MLKRTWLLVCVVCCLAGLVGANTPAREHPIGMMNKAKSNNISHGADGTGVAAHGEEAGGPRMERYPVAVIDFERVQTPFIIGLWIFLACLGKIGKL